MAKGAAKGKREHTKPEPIPHHIKTMTIGPAAIEAKIPAN
jgi:hypothetical protein